MGNLRAGSATIWIAPPTSTCAADARRSGGASVGLGGADGAFDALVDGLRAERRLLDARRPGLDPVGVRARGHPANVSGGRLGGAVEGRPLPLRPAHEPIDERAPARDERDAEHARRRERLLVAA